MSPIRDSRRRLSRCEGLAVGRKARQEIFESTMGEVEPCHGGTAFAGTDVAEVRRCVNTAAIEVPILKCFGAGGIEQQFSL